MSVVLMVLSTSSAVLVLSVGVWLGVVVTAIGSVMMFVMVIEIHDVCIDVYWLKWFFTMNVEIL